MPASAAAIGGVLRDQHRRRSAAIENTLPTSAADRPPRTKASSHGIPARATLIGAEHYNDFVPYGTPCSENFDPATQKLELLQCEVEQLRRRLAELLDKRDGGERKERDSA